MEATEQKPGRALEADFVMPADVAEWVGQDSVREWVLAEISALDWDNPSLQEFLRTHPNFQPRQLLGLLTFAYATGVLESEEIVGQCYRDPVLRQMINGHVPTPAEIGKFRKANRGLLKWCLAQVFKRAMRTRYDLGELMPAGIRQRLVRDATERLDMARHMDRAAQGA